MSASERILDAGRGIKADIESSAGRVARWVEEHRYEAYDPGDGQRSFLRALTFGAQPLERILTAVVLRVPINVRPAIGIGPHTSTKGMGYMAWGYLWRFQATGDREFASKAEWCLAWLKEHRSSGFDNHCWGNDFTFTTRAGRIRRDEPTIVWSGLIGQAFVEAYELLGRQEYLDIAASTCRWILELPRERTSSGNCLSYVAGRQSSIHNSNMLGGALLARVGRLLDWNEAMDVARSAMAYSCKRQKEDGSWFYGEEPKYHWIDNFHTGYNLDSLLRYQLAADDQSFAEQLERGYDYFRNNFFEGEGRPRYMHNRSMPTDIQCCAQAIDTLTFFSRYGKEDLGLACRVAAWTIRNMQANDGHFFYRDLGWMKVRTPMLHWGQGTMFKALAHLSARLGSASGVLSQPTAALV
jgi:rhamnogalacturonyl hydrolase YesR